VTRLVGDNVALRSARALIRLPRGERRVVLEAALELVRSSVELGLYPRRRTVALLGSARAGERDDPVGPRRLREAEIVGVAVTRVANRLPWRPTCLRQALAAQRMLRRRRIPNRLHLGVTSPSEPAAHAWVSVEGQPVVGQQGIERFAPLASFS
jgi:hypothetical protein